MLAAVAILIAASWSGSGFVQPGPPEDVAEQIDEIVVHGPESDESTKQIEAARVAATNIINSGCLGDPHVHGFAVNINGHSNPENTAEGHSAPDCIGVSIRQSKESVSAS